MNIDQLTALSPSELAKALTGAEISYRKVSTDKVRHMRIEAVHAVSELSWKPEGLAPDAPAIYTAKSGALCVFTHTKTFHGKREVKDKERPYCTLHVENITAYKKVKR